MEVQRSSVANTVTHRGSTWETGGPRANGTDYSVGSPGDVHWGPEVGWWVVGRAEGEKGGVTKDEQGLLGFLMEPTQHQLKAEARGAVKKRSQNPGDLKDISEGVLSKTSLFLTMAPLQLSSLPRDMGPGHTQKPGTGQPLPLNRRALASQELLPEGKGDADRLARGTELGPALVPRSAIS